jgi:hypothetical protein
MQRLWRRQVPCNYWSYSSQRVHVLSVELTVSNRKQAEYQLSSGEDPQTIKDTYMKLLKLLAPHCTTEKDRAIIYDKIT